MPSMLVDFDPTVSPRDNATAQARQGTSVLTFKVHIVSLILACLVKSLNLHREETWRAGVSSADLCAIITALDRRYIAQESTYDPSM